MSLVKVDNAGADLSVGAGTWFAVRDTVTGLFWAAGETSPMIQSAADAYAQALVLASFSDWRLPTIKELFALADRTRSSPALDTVYFASCKLDWYWSSTVAQWDATLFWVADFLDGESFAYRNDDACFVRPVRP